LSNYVKSRLLSFRGGDESVLVSDSNLVSDLKYPHVGFYIAIHDVMEDEIASDGFMKHSLNDIIDSAETVISRLSSQLAEKNVSKNKMETGNFHLTLVTSCTYIKNPLHWNEDGDGIFLGKSTNRRDSYIRKIKKAATKLKLNYLIDEEMVSIKEHISLLQRSKLIYHFMALGYRSSREWEAMINGGLLISDDRHVDTMLTPGMELNKDFIRFDPGGVIDQMEYWIKHNEKREKLSVNGFNSAWKVWNGCRDPYMADRRKAAEVIQKMGWDK